MSNRHSKMIQFREGRAEKDAEDGREERNKRMAKDKEGNRENLDHVVHRVQMVWTKEVDTDMPKSVQFKGGSY